MQRLLDFVAEMESKNVSYRLGVARPNAVMVEVCVPGSRWEVEFFVDGTVEIEQFESKGVTDETAFEELRKWLD